MTIVANIFSNTVRMVVDFKLFLPSSIALDVWGRFTGDFWFYMLLLKLYLFYHDKAFKWGKLWALAALQFSQLWVIGSRIIIFIWEEIISLRRMLLCCNNAALWIIWRIVVLTTPNKRIFLNSYLMMEVKMSVFDYFWLFRAWSGSSGRYDTDL